MTDIAKCEIVNKACLELSKTNRDLATQLMSAWIERSGELSTANHLAVVRMCVLKRIHDMTMECD